MKNVELKPEGQMPIMGLGTWQLSGKRCIDVVKTAIRMGYSHIDTADAYENHADIARAIQDADRSSLFITSKVWREDLAGDGFYDAVRRFLDELQTNYLDLVLVHWPDSAVDARELFLSAERSVREGFAKAVGVSNYTIAHLEEAQRVSPMPIAVNQVEFHPYLYQEELLKYCHEKGILLTAYSPLGRGGPLLSDEVIVGIAEAHSCTAAQVCLAWAMQHGVVVIPKSSSQEHLRQNLETASIDLTAAEMEAIDGIDRHQRIIDPQFAEFDV